MVPINLPLAFKLVETKADKTEKESSEEVQNIVAVRVVYKKASGKTTW